MIKSKGIFAVSFIAMMVAGGAYANIASQGYVDQQIDTRQVAGDYATNAALSSVRTTATSAQSAATAAQTAADDAADAADAAASAAATAQSTANAKVSTAQGSSAANKAVITNASGNITTGTISSAMITDGTITNADIATNAAIAASKVSGLSTVATSGSYNDLADKPSIPSAYVLKAATADALGGVKSGGDITVGTDGAVTVNSATRADSATTATTATNATKATQDASGNVITTTYATKAQLTALDSSTSGSGAVVTDVSQTDGKVTVTKGNVQIPVGSATATDSYATIWVE